MKELIFKDFKVAVQKQFEFMRNKKLFLVDVGRDLLWNTYINSFPEETNQMFRERTAHDCQSCKYFIRACGHMVAVENNNLVSIWDIDIDGSYKVVADAMSKAVKSAAIRSPFLYFQTAVGTDHNIQLLENNETIKWEHFHLMLPHDVVKPNTLIGTELSKLNTNKDLFVRCMEEISLSAAEACQELIEQNSLYRGEEHLETVLLFIDQKKKYDKVLEKKRDNYCWLTSMKLGMSSRIKNSVIGTLLVDMSGDMDINEAVRLFEAKVAPQNYKRPTALITKSMIAAAQKEAVDLGIEDSFYRRFAVTDDITINNVLFADREAKRSMGVFDALDAKVSVSTKKFDKVDEVGIDSFIKDILPRVDTVELVFENQHINNLMSLIAPMRPNAKPIFQWNNNFSWAYNGEVTDSIREAVKKSGGVVDGVLNYRLAWNDIDGKDSSDLDAWAQEPSKTKIGYCTEYRRDQGAERTPMSGQLDVDNRDPWGKMAVENITWIDRSKMKDGVYKLWVNQYSAKNSQGFKAEIEFGGNTYSYSYERPVRNNVHVAEVTLKNGVFTISHKLPESNATKTIWNISTQQFHKVLMIMNSPNHWDGHKTGNRHVFFILDRCKNGEKARGFFNEFLSNELIKHRKVFEVLGSKLKVEESDNQLSGIGFSSTKKTSVVCKLTGSFARTIKINF